MATKELVNALEDTERFELTACEFARGELQAQVDALLLSGEPHTVSEARDLLRPLVKRLRAKLSVELPFRSSSTSEPPTSPTSEGTGSTSTAATVPNTKP